MDRAALVEMIAERAAADADFARLIERRHGGDVSVDREIQSALPATAVPRQYLVTYRGIRRVLGARMGASSSRGSFGCRVSFGGFHMKQIKITGPTVSAVYGRLGVCDVIRCGNAEAAEFVDQLRCGEFVEPAGQADAGVNIPSWTYSVPQPA